MSGQTLPAASFFGAYCQVSDLNRSLAFYRDVMGLEVVYDDDKLAILHGRNASQDSVVLRAMVDPPHHLGDAGITRLFWRVGEPADIDVAEGVLTEHGISHSRHKEEKSDGLLFRDPDGLDIVLLHMAPDKSSASPPAWLSWEH
jgi:catechol 2,3-dioxygenase-like lactoylglutathione lyase family enzyme